MWITGAPGRSAATAAGERGLAGPGRPVDADQPAGAERGRARLGERQQQRRGVLRAATGSERQAEAAVRRDRVDERVARPAGGRCWCARTARRTSRAGTTPGRRSAAGRGRVPGQRGLHLAGALEPGQVQARPAPTGIGSRSLAGRARRRPGRRRARSPPAARDGVRPGSAEERGRARARRTGSGRTAPAPAARTRPRPR